MNITIYAEGGVEEWGPHTLEKGMGGSESAAVYIAGELQDLGNDVAVYNSVSDENECHEPDPGPLYLNFKKASQLEATDALIVWRIPSLIIDTLSHVKAKKKYLWLHDMVPEKEVLPYIYVYDKVMVLSEFHRAQYPNIPDDRIWVTRNGINVQDTGEQVRDPWQLIYASAYSRGLLILLENWTSIKLKFPKLTLKVAYGWQTDEFLAKAAGDRMEREYLVFREYMEGLFDQEGITHLGRVSKEELAKEMSRSQLLAYPCTFPEISCITAMEAQCYGAVPVTTQNAALPETVKYGFRTEGDYIVQESYMELLEYALSHPEEVEEMRKKGMGHARKNLTWRSLSEEWIKEFGS